MLEDGFLLAIANFSQGCCSMLGKGDKAAGEGDHIVVLTLREGDQAISNYQVKVTDGK